MKYHIIITAEDDGKPEETYFVQSDSLTDEKIKGKHNIDLLLERVAKADWETQ